MIKLDDKTAAILAKQLAKMQFNRIAFEAPGHPKVFFEWMDKVIFESKPGRMIVIGEMKPSPSRGYETMMNFLVIDTVLTSTESLSAEIYPTKFCDLTNFVMSYAAIVRGGEVEACNEMLQQSLGQYARDWINEMAAAGYFS